MKNFRGYTLFDLFFIGIGLLTLIIVSVFVGSQWYIILNTVIGLLCVFTQAKGKVISLFLGIIHFALYVYIAYIQNYFGESILYLCVMIPMYIYGIVHWLRNRNKKDNVVIVRSNLSIKEWCFFVLGLIIFSILIYFFLKSINTKQLFFSTLSFVSMVPAVYLLIRRCKWNQMAFLINDFITPILWINAIISNDISYLPMVLYHVFQISYDAYGLIEWRKLEKNQVGDACNK